MNARLSKPPLMTQRWMRMMLAFGFSVALGMAPLLGKIKIPGFSSLLEMFPTFPFDFTTQLLAVTGLLMGLTALLVQYFQYERISSVRRRLWFIRLAIVLGFALIVLFALYVFNVEQAGNYNVLIGWNEPICRACAEMARSECLSEITLATKDIDRCFGSFPVRLAALLLAVLYMAAMSLLGALVGLLVLREKR